MSATSHNSLIRFRKSEVTGAPLRRKKLCDSAQDLCSDAKTFVAPNPRLESWGYQYFAPMGLSAKPYHPNSGG
ncbi:MAG: hypothetical protein Q8N05_09310 [Bacteroidota bacterium]|nr:hypothetical protein [Bacteroidota bacterium]